MELLKIAVIKVPAGGYLRVILLRFRYGAT